MLRFLTAGESHGPGLVTIVEGLPAGLEVSGVALAGELARRRGGHGRGARMALESDELEIVGGVRFGRTLGGPVAVLVRNREWPDWRERMSTEAGGAAVPLTVPRPGHADLPGMLKYATYDARDILERASARETAARTVAGWLGKRLLAEAGVVVVSHVVAIGGVRSAGAPPGPDDLDRVDASPVRCLDPVAEAAMVAEIDAAAREEDTLGGVVEVIAYGVPAGVGSHTHWDRRLDGLLAGALMSIPAIKAVEVGDGLPAASRRGSLAHDEIDYREGAFLRATGRAGGIEGGMSTGQPIRVRAAMKPLPTVARGLASVDTVSKKRAEAPAERSDTCAVPAAGVVAEQMVSWILAAEMERMFGGDTVGDFRAAVEAYRRRLAGF
jgi:chorismate synthase